MSKVRLRAPLCAGHMLMSNGQGIAAGGTTDYSPWKGSKALYTFDFGSEKFVRQQNMVDGRWYPTVVNTRGGYALIVGGFNSSGANSKTSEVYIPWTRTYDTRPGNREFPCTHTLPDRRCEVLLYRSRVGKGA